MNIEVLFMLVALISLVAVLINIFTSYKNRKDTVNVIVSFKEELNSRMTELLTSVSEASFAKGLLAGKLENRENKNDISS